MRMHAHTHLGSKKTAEREKDRSNTATMTPAGFVRGERWAGLDGQLRDRRRDLFCGRQWRRKRSGDHMETCRVHVYHREATGIYNAILYILYIKQS